jgi:hypothetical protein
MPTDRIHACLPPREVKRRHLAWNVFVEAANMSVAGSARGHFCRLTDLSGALETEKLAKQAVACALLKENRL